MRTTRRDVVVNSRSSQQRNNLTKHFWFVLRFRVAPDYQQI